jgi:hypothetical protein
MRRTSKIALAFLILLGARIATAHRIDEYLQATMVSIEANRIHASMRLIPGVQVASVVIAEIDSNADGVFSEDEERAYAQHVLSDLYITIDGKSVRPQLVAFDFPALTQMREGLGEIHFEYTAEPPNDSSNRALILTNHHMNRMSVYLMNVIVPDDPNIRILAQKRNPQQSIYELDYQQILAGGLASKPPVARVGIWLNGVQFSRLFALGVRHIAEGTDHLLFLLALLLPAPLVVMGSRWGSAADWRQSLRRILMVVTAFTFGHSITLALAAFGAVRVPSRPVEVLIAVSIFISAMHAIRPLFPGKEVWIAAFFGLIHGLAFAAVLTDLGLNGWYRLISLLGFNLGIESMQLVVIAATLPSLLLLSRTRAYPIFRLTGAMFALVASLGWMVARLFNTHNAIDPFVERIAQQGMWIALLLLVSSIVLWSLGRSVFSQSVMRVPRGPQTATCNNKPA